MIQNIRYYCLSVLILLTLSIGTIGVYADSSSWDFSNSADYTLSDDSISSVQSGYADLDLQLIQTGAIANNAGTLRLDRALRVHVVGNHAYVSAQTQDSIQSINISDPTNPTAAGNVVNNNGTLRLDYPRDIIANGNYLYIAVHISDAIQILDISNPANPIAAGNYVNNGSVRLNGPRGLAIQGNYLYVASTIDDALQIFDISTPTNLVPVGQLDTANGRLNGARDVIVEGNYAYVSARLNDSIQIIDISNPATPSFVGEIVNNGTDVFLDNVFGIAKDGNYIYAAGYNQDRIQIIDVSDPTNPTAAANLGTTELPGLDGPRDVIVDDGFLYVADYLGDSIQVIDISDPTNPRKESELQNSASVNINGPRDLQKMGDFIYGAIYVDDDLSIFETIYNTASPSVVPNTAINIGLGTLDSFSQTLTAQNEGSVSYQLSKDNGTTWYYFNGSSWQTTTNGVSNSSSISQINTNIGAFNALTGGSGEFLWKAFLTSNGKQKVELDDISISYTPLIPPTPPLNFEVAGGYTVTEGTWTRQTTTVQEGSYALESDNGGADNSNSCFERTETTVDGDSYKFWYKVSSEQNYDFLRFYDNGTEVITWSGEVDWSEYTHSPTAGSHTFRWCYTKDGSVSNGSDKAWIDDGRIETPTTPGGVGGLNIWFKSNKGTSTTTDGGALNFWNDQSGNNHNATAGTAPIFRNSDTTQVNYYPTIDFDGTSQYLQNLDGAADTRSYFMVIVPDKAIEGTVSEGVPFGFDCESGTLSSGTCGIPFAGLALGAFTVAIPDEVLTHAIGSSANWRSAKTATVVYPADFPLVLGVNENATGNGTDIFKEGEKINNFSTGPYQYISGADFNLGKAPDPNYPSYYDGKIAEIFNYNGRVDDTARAKIESYLAFKYGLTLNNGNSDYIASDGSTLMWSTTIGGIYNHDVFGIGYDMDQELLQPESKSTNPDGVMRIGALGEGTNQAPSFTDIENNEFFSMAHDAGGNTWKTIGAPSGYSILGRMWKTQEVGDVGTIRVDIDTENTVFNIPVPSAGANYYLLYDTNGNNDLSDETPLIMSDIGGNIWRYSGINMSHNRIFTIASEASSNNIPTDISLSNTSINENSGINFTVGNLSSIDADPADTHTYSLVAGFGDEDNQYFTITGNTINIVHSADYEIKNNYNIRIQTDDGNGGQYQESFTITINNLGETISTFIDFEDVINDYKFVVASGNWSDTTTNPYAGSQSLESNNGGVNNSQSCVEVIHTSLTDETMSFYYNVSSQENSDYLHFYIDSVEQNTWSGTVPWTQYTSSTIPAGVHEYKWCYIKDGGGSAGTDNAFIDNVEFAGGSSDVIPPVILATNFASGFLLPGGGHTISISYSDADSGINTSSDTIILNKWDGTAWGVDIAASSLVVGSKIVTATGASYPMNNLSYGKYRYTFSISDNSSNTASETVDFYIDSPEINVSTPEVDLGNIDVNSNSFSSDIVVTVRTVGAPFRVLLDRNGDLQSGSNIIQNFDGSTGYGFDSAPYSGNISAIGSAEVLASQSGSININGQYNTYNYNLKIGALIGEEQVAGDYEGYINFGLELDY